MNFTQKKTIPSGKERDELHKINSEYTECISKEFLPDFLAGKPVRVEDYCTAIRVKMLALDKQIYPNDQFWAFPFSI